MLRINRLRVEINTVNGVYGIDTSFSSGLNFIASEDNTCGKSSILAAIYYSHELIEIIDNLKPDTYQKINITGKAFQLLP